MHRIWPITGKLAHPLVWLLFFWTCGILFPSFPKIIGIGLDPSWKHGLNLAHVSHLVFGRDIVFTYGPLAYFYYPDARSVNPWAVFFWSLSIYGVSIYLLVKLLRICRSNPAAIGILLVLSFSAAFELAAGYTERLQTTFLLGSWLLVVNRSFENFFEYCLVGAIAGITLLVKLNDGVVDTAVFYSLYLCSFLRCREFHLKAIAVALSPPIAFCLVFVFVNGPLTGIYSYLQSSFLISSGYSEAMSVVGPSWQVLLAAIGISSLVGTLLFRNMDIPYQTLLPTLLLSFAAFKHCMVRQDGQHAIPFHAELAAICGFGFMTVENNIRRRFLLWVSVANICFGMLIAYKQSPEISGKILSLLQLRSLPGDLNRYAHLCRSWRILKSQTSLALQKKTDPHLSKVVRDETVDDLTWNVDLIFANSFRWNPRPIFQSYSAYEPALDRMNATHLAFAGADYLTLRYEAIDGRHPFLDDVSTWRKVFDLYDVSGGDLDFLVLKRRRKPRFSKLHPIEGVHVARWGESVPLPPISDDQILIMSAETKKTLWGWVKATFFRIDPVYLQVSFRSGSETRFRITRPNLVNGAIISYLPRSLPNMAPLLGFGDAVDRDSVVSIRWISPGVAEFKDPIRLSWSVVQARKADRDRQLPLSHPDTTSFVPLWKPKHGFAATSGLRAEEDSKVLVLHPTSGDSQIFLRSTQELTDFKTLLIRGKFSVADQVNLFFGQQGNGRSFGGFVPITGNWIDIYVDVGRNPFWRSEAGSLLRFDPVTSLFHDSQIELAGIWGSNQTIADKPGEMNFYLSQSEGELP